MITGGTPAPIAETTVQTASANAPTAGAAIKSLAAPAAGSYRIAIWYAITGAQETAALNLRLSYNGVAKCDLPTAMTFNAGNGLAGPVILERVDLDGINVVKLTAVANAVASTVYTVGFALTRYA